MSYHDQQRLIVAAVLVESTVEGLDRSSTVCACCGTTRYTNWDHEQAARQLAPLAEKLRAYARGKLFASEKE